LFDSFKLCRHSDHHGIELLGHFDLVDDFDFVDYDLAGTSISFF
jgi:hypothetical protein